MNKTICLFFIILLSGQTIKSQWHAFSTDDKKNRLHEMRFASNYYELGLREMENSDSLKEMVSIHINLFKESAQKGSFVNHTITCPKDCTFAELMTFVRLCYSFDNLDSEITDLIWNGKQISSHHFNKILKSSIPNHYKQTSWILLF